MIIKEKNERINFLVKNFLLPNETLRSLDPIVAGGSVVFYALLERLCSTEFHWNLLKKKLNKANPRAVKGGLVSGAFTDIDIWFESNNDIHSNLESQYRFLIENEDERDSATKANNRPLINEDGKSLGIGYLSKSTNWANTFDPYTISAENNSMSKVHHQFIKKPTHSVANLLNGFDFANCMIAWKDDNIYYDAEIMKYFDQGILKLNNNETYISGTLPSRVFNALRALKYSKRYELDFDEELTQHVYQILFECKHIDYRKYEENIELINMTYGVNLSTKNTFKNMVLALEAQFETISKMRFFKMEQALYLIDNEKDLPGLKRFIEENSDIKTETDEGILF